jgi:hypothetical protein
LVSPGALGNGALSAGRGEAASRSFPAASAATANELLTKSLRIIAVFPPDYGSKTLTF